VTKPLLLDLFCCVGGAAVGYARAGFEVVGVDNKPQPNYPFKFIKADAIAYGRAHARQFDAVHASPPCQTYSKTKNLHNRKHPDLVATTRDMLMKKARVWVIENVEGSPLIDPVLLCGTEFGMVAKDVDGEPLKLIRHRLFESNVPLARKGECNHDSAELTASVYGAGGGWTPIHREAPYRRGGYVPATSVIQRLLGIDWMTKNEMSQSVPPVFAEHIGRQLLEGLER